MTISTETNLNRMSNMRFSGGFARNYRYQHKFAHKRQDASSPVDRVTHLNCFSCKYILCNNVETPGHQFVNIPGQ